MSRSKVQMSSLLIALLFFLLGTACTSPGGALLQPSPSSVPNSTTTSSPVALPTTFSSATLPPTIPATIVARPPATQGSTPGSGATSAAPPPPRPTLSSRVTVVPTTQCPPNVPAVVIAPGADPPGFAWSPVIVPMGDPCIGSIVVDPTDERTWYVGGANGIYITRDRGVSWEHPLTAEMDALTLAPTTPNQVYAGGRESLYESADKGRTWKGIGKFDTGTAIRSLHVGRDGALFVGLHWAVSRKLTEKSEGIYISRDRGANWQFSSFGTAPRGLIVWSIAQDPRNGTLYAGTEIYNHPQPYKPPFFRSTDGAKTWQEISGTISWHVLQIQVRADTSQVYALTEGAGLYTSNDRGDHWVALGSPLVYALQIDSNHPDRLFGGASAYQRQKGGVYFSTNGGAAFAPVGIVGISVQSIALSGDSTTVYIVSYASGIYTSRVP